MSHRALIGFLITSVAVNLLLAGLIIGHIMRPDGGRQLPLAWAFKEVSPEIREKVGPIIRPHVSQIHAERRELRRQERRLRRLIESETLTREALEAALESMRVATSEFHEKVHVIGVDVLLALDAKERSAAAPYLFSPPHLGPGGSRRLRDEKGRNRKGEGPNPQRAGSERQ